jgi:hypothetical protein
MKMGGIDGDTGGDEMFLVAASPAVEASPGCDEGLLPIFR